MGSRKGGRRITKADRIRNASPQKPSPTPGQLAIAVASIPTKEASGLDIPATVAVNIPERPPPKGAPPPPAKSTNKETGFAHKWKNFWAFFGPVITVLGLVNYYWPSLTIATGVNLSGEELFQTQFVVNNSGHNSLYDLTFVCDIVGNVVAIDELNYDARNLQPIPVLTPNHPVSRGCFAKSLIENGPWLKVTVKYRWPLIGRPTSEIAFFSAKRGANGGFYLVPEAAPTPEPPSMLEMNGPNNAPTGPAL